MRTAIEIGTRIHYTGDVANNPGEGRVTGVVPCDWYGFKITVTLDDGRVCRGLTPSSFGPYRPGNCTDRFQVMPSDVAPTMAGGAA